MKNSCTQIVKWPEELFPSREFEHGWGHPLDEDERPEGQSARERKQGITYQPMRKALMDGGRRADRVKSESVAGNRAQLSREENSVPATPIIFHSFTPTYEPPHLEAPTCQVGGPQMRFPNVPAARHKLSRAFQFIGLSLFALPL